MIEHQYISVFSVQLALPKADLSTSDCFPDGYWYYPPAQAVPGGGAQAGPGAQAALGGGAQAGPGAQAALGGRAQAVSDSGAQAAPGSGAQAASDGGAQTGPGSSKRRIRTVFDASAIRTLEREFKLDKYPDYSRRCHIAHILKVNEERVQVRLATHVSTEGRRNPLVPLRDNMATLIL